MRAAIVLAALVQVTTAADFVWKHGGVRIGRLSVPAERGLLEGADCPAF